MLWRLFGGSSHALLNIPATTPAKVSSSSAAPEYICVQRLCCSVAVAMFCCITALQKLRQKSGVIAGVQDLPPYLSPGPSANSFNSTDNHNNDISCHQIKLHTREGPPPAWFQQAAMDPSSYNFAFCTCAGNFRLQVQAAPPCCDPMATFVNLLTSYCMSSQAVTASIVLKYV